MLCFDQRLNCDTCTKKVKFAKSIQKPGNDVKMGTGLNVPQEK